MCGEDTAGSRAGVSMWRTAQLLAGSSLGHSQSLDALLVLWEWDEAFHALRELASYFLGNEELPDRAEEKKAAALSVPLFQLLCYRSYSNQLL